MDFFKSYKYVLVSFFVFALIIIFQEEIFDFFEENINWRIFRIIGPLFDDSIKWIDDLFRLLNKSRKALIGIFSGLVGFFFYKRGINK